MRASRVSATIGDGSSISKMAGSTADLGLGLTDPCLLTFSGVTERVDLKGVFAEDVEVLGVGAFSESAGWLTFSADSNLAIN